MKNVIDYLKHVYTLANNVKLIARKTETCKGEHKAAEEGISLSGTGGVLSKSRAVILQLWSSP
jgi:hypothetical protein